MKDELYIEEQNYKDRVEFRVKIVGNYPKYLKRKGKFKRYMSRFQGTGLCGGQVDYVFKAYKKPPLVFKLLGRDYKNQRRIAIQSCERLIKNYKKALEEPKIIKYRR